MSFIGEGFDIIFPFTYTHKLTRGSLLNSENAYKPGPFPLNLDPNIYYYYFKPDLYTFYFPFRNIEIVYDNRRLAIVLAAIGRFQNS